ncbi:uncharacterized protein BT62DRAFT_757700 [Guyanagaster necrorhizus]|uniref:Uncharacterized protein n=1 Tax=Guyanagaster necrorhizus TaxID=856835 RepID=A0A9P7VVM2_9AGAR|nr:uncharacterized protein BT62DRAFT_757700 [Guyanagaster necrorhizus MCA 3950]KAG7448183.1 hypothetical protein BT62DRAFT_757700 [Guyanagaster necrorhizus MCA 3950]
MDVDPLQDIIPSRYAIESDEEDEFNPLQRRPDSQDVPEPLNVQIVGSIPTAGKLIVASGDAGKIWARGDNLGEQTGAVYVNGISVCLCFNPEWTSATIIISEVTTRLPIWAMNGYGKHILETLRPSRVSILDVYPVPSYITSEPLSFQNAPIRYLATTRVDPDIAERAEKFSPPNLISSTSAAFMADLSVSKVQGVLFVLPYPRIPPPAPRKLSPSNIENLTDDLMPWNEDTMSTVQTLLFKAIDEKAPDVWVNKSSKGIAVRVTTRQKGDIGEGGMYI